MNLGGSYYLVLVNKDNVPIFEADFVPSVPSFATSKPDDKRQLNQSVAHAALDLINRQLWKQASTITTYFRSIDRFNDWNVSSFTSASFIRFVLLHETKNEEGIKQFFHDLCETYAKLSMNPFFSSSQTIKSVPFERRCAYLAKRYLTG